MRGCSSSAKEHHCSRERGRQAQRIPAVPLPLLINLISLHSVQKLLKLCEPPKPKVFWMQRGRCCVLTSHMVWASASLARVWDTLVGFAQAPQSPSIPVLAELFMPLFTTVTTDCPDWSCCLHGMKRYHGHFSERQAAQHCCQ